MSVTVTPGALTGAVKAPPSKSLTHRYLVTASLAEGESLLEYPLRCGDTLATVQGLKKVNIDIDDTGEIWVINGGTLSPPSSIIDCNESGTTLRFLTGLCSLLEKPSPSPEPHPSSRDLTNHC